ncbi:MAG: glycosyltransferase family 4 protein [Bacteroidota bacterium]
MRIAVNTRLLIKNKLEGIGWFTVEHFSRICRNHPEHEFFFLFDRPYDKSFLFSQNITPITIWPPARHPLLFYCWFNLRLPAILKKLKADVLVSPDGYLPLRGEVPSIAVIHDINFHHFPKDFRWDIRWYYTHFFSRFARKANKIVTVSEFSKQDIISAFTVPTKKIEVVPNAANDIYKPATNEIKIATRQQLTAGKSYFLFVGALNPRKNVTRLLQSFETFKEKSNSSTQLVIVGTKMFGTKKMEATYKRMRYKSEVHFPGRMEPEQLKNVYAAARALVFVPYFEGFGIPLVEAMKCELPIIAGNTSSLPEVAGDAALYVSPYDCSAIAQAMCQLDSQPELRKSLIEKGKQQALKYNWDHSAALFWSTIEKVLNS